MTRTAAALAALVVFCVAMPAARAQRTDTSAKPTADPRDTVYLRARKLVLEGNGAAGRAIVDSALTATTGTSDYATALFWRASLAATAADAERDYRRVIVEYPFSTHSGDALLALAQLEMARGDRDPAIDHLQRFLLQRPNDPERVRAGIWLGRLLLEQNQVAKGCAVLLRTRATLGDTAVETRNQVDYYATRCAGVDTIAPVTRVAAAPARPARADTVRPPRRDTLRRDSARSDSAKAPAPRHRDSVPSGGAHREATAPNAETAAKRYTVQLAAYDTRESADQLVSRLSARGIVARVVGKSTAPYRVRVGHYANDAEATAALRELKRKGLEGFVTTTDNETAPPAVRR